MCKVAENPTRYIRSRAGRSCKSEETDSKRNGDKCRASNFREGLWVHAWRRCIVWMDGRCWQTWHLSRRPLSILQMPHDKSILAFLSEIHEISHPLLCRRHFFVQLAPSNGRKGHATRARMPYTYGQQGDWKGCRTGNGGKLSNS